MKINSYLPDKHKYLQIISTLAKKPKIVHVLGELPRERQVSVAIVGTRQPTLYGTQVTFELAYTLAKSGVIIISGLAHGIDAEAHKGALAAGGKTIAVMAHGLDTLYPAKHRGLAAEIIKAGGALISEYPVGTPAFKHTFLERNRIVSGLADAVIVTEAGKRSGTLATVMHALEQGKEVFAVPGSILSQQSVGPNTLLQQGAHPVLSASDVLTIIAPQLVKPTLSTTPTSAVPHEQCIIDLLARGITHTTELQAQSGLTPSDYMQALSMLELQGIITPNGHLHWNLIYQ